MLDSFQMWACEYIQLCMPKPEKPQLFAQNQALGGSLFYLWFSLLFMFYPGFRSSRQPGKQTFRSNQTGVFSPGPSSTLQRPDNAAQYPGTKHPDQHPHQLLSTLIQYLTFLVRHVGHSSGLC